MQYSITEQCKEIEQSIKTTQKESQSEWTVYQRSANYGICYLGSLSESHSKLKTGLHG